MMIISLLPRTPWKQEVLSADPENAKRIVNMNRPHPSVSLSSTEITTDAV